MVREVNLLEPVAVKSKEACKHEQRCQGDAKQIQNTNSHSHHFTRHHNKKRMKANRYKNMSNDTTHHAAYRIVVTGQSAPNPVQRSKTNVASVAIAAFVLTVFALVQVVEVDAVLIVGGGIQVVGVHGHVSVSISKHVEHTIAILDLISSGRCKN